MPGPVQAGTAFVAIQGDFAPLGKQLRARGGILHRESTHIGGLIGAGIAGGALAAGKGLFEIGKQFDDASDKIRIQTGSTGKRLKGLQGAFKDVVRDVPTDFDTASTAVAGLNQRLGVTGKPLRKLSKQLVELSKITGTDIGENVASTTRLFGDWSIKTGQQSKTLDKLFRVSQRTGISVSGLSRSMVAFGSPLRQLGINFDFAASMFGEFEKNGVNTQTLMPGLRFAIKSFSGAIPKTSTELKKLGVNMKDPQVALQQVMKLIKDAPSDLKANSLAFKVFGVRAGPDMAAAIREGHFQLGGLMKTMRGGHDTIHKAARDTEDFNEKWQRFKNRTLVGLQPLATRVFNAVGKEADKLFKIIEDPKLTGDQKFKRVLDRLLADVEKMVPKVSGVIDKALPVLIASAAQAAPRVVSAFANSFVNAGPWGKLLIGGWLLRKMGGLRAFERLGLVEGAAMGRGMAEGAALSGGAGRGGGGGGAGGAVAGGAAAGALARVAGKVKGLAGKGSKLAGRFAALALAINLVDSKGNLIAASVNTAHDLSFGIVPKVHAKTGEEQQSDQFVKLSKGLDAAVKGRDTSSLDAMIGKFRAMAKEARDFNAKPVAAQYDKLAASASDSLGKILRRTRDTSAASGRFADAIRGMRLHGSKDFDGLVHQVTFGSKQILRIGGGNTTKTRQAIEKQFGLARDRVRESMHDQTISVKKGTELLHTLAVKELGLYGIKAGKVDVVLAKGAKGQLRPNQRGGHINEGAPTGDSVPALLERDEYVLNRKAVRKVGRRALDRLNFGMAPRFQRGGSVGMQDGGSVSGDTDFLPTLMARLKALSAAAHRAIFVQSGRRTVAEQLAQGPSTPNHPVAGPNGPHVQGIAADITPGFGVFGRLASRFGLGFTVMPQEPWHIQLLNAAAAGAGPAAFKGLSRVLLQGSGGVGQLAGQGALDRIRGAANASVAKAIDASTFNGSESAVTGGVATGNGAGLMRQIAAQRGWSFPDWWALDASESSHGANLANPTSTARLRGQFLDSNWGKYGSGSDPRQNPSMGQQIEAMAAYIAQRYGNPTKAWAFHRAHNFYQRGGLVGLTKGGSPNTASGSGNVNHPGQAGPKPSPTLAGVLRRVAHSKSPKLRNQAVKGLLDKVKTIGLPSGLQKRLAKYSGNVNAFGDFADRAGQLSVDPDENGKGGAAGVVNGKTQAQWLTHQLDALFKWRNAIIRAEGIVAKRRELTARLIGQSRKRLATVVDRIRKIDGTRKRLNAQLVKAQKKPKRNRALIKGLKGRLHGLDAAERPLNRVRGALHDKIIPGLVNKRGALNTARGDLLDNLSTAQGPGSPMSRLARLPALGVLGGQIFDVQMSLRDLAAPKPAVTDTITDDTAAPDDNGRADILAQLLQQANLRTATSEAQFDVFKNVPPFGGSFKDGGVVPGPSGAPRMILAHGGETVTPVDGSPAGGMIVHEHHVYLDGRHLDAKIDTRVVRVTRQQARHAGRKLPGRGGGLSRA